MSINGIPIYLRRKSHLTFWSNAPFTLAIGTDSGAEWDGTLQYSTDEQTWNTWNGRTISSNAANRLFLRGVGNTRLRTSTASNEGRFLMTGSGIHCDGELNTLLDYRAVENGRQPTVASANIFAELFKGCTALVSAPRLSLKSVPRYGYYSLFQGCTNLVSMPPMSATSTGTNACERMFDGCTSLTGTQSIRVAQLQTSALRQMFRGCTSLVTAPQILATSFASGASASCYGMYDGCTSLVNASVPQINTLVSNCYIQMFNGCTALVNAPALPATTLAGGCYQMMFDGCTSLTNAPALPATTLAGQCYRQMFQGCTSLATTPALRATSVGNGSCYLMFDGCTSLTTLPALPATLFSDDDWYYGMFNRCTNIKVSRTQTSVYAYEYRIPTQGSGPSGTISQMFTGTGGTFTGSPSMNTTYYTNNQPIT